MPSFDVVSQIDLHELSNACDQAAREVSTRFDFKGTSARVEYKEPDITLYGDNEFQIKQVLDILEKKLTKRGIDIGAMSIGKLETTGNTARQAVILKQGIDQPTAKQIIKLVKETRLKVQASIQGDQIRISGKKRDDLQSAIASLKDASIDQPLQYINFRD